MVRLEVCCFNIESARRADWAHVDRIELCRDARSGGLTPDEDVFLQAHRNLRTPVHVMVRTLSNTPVLNEHDLRQMEAEIRNFSYHDPAGYVFGGLGPDMRINEHDMRSLMMHTRGKPCTFHRAFDNIDETLMELELEKLIRLGFKAVLTSGGAPTAWDGRHRLQRLVHAARGRIEIIVAGSVRTRDVGMLRDIGAPWFHSSAILDGSEEASSGEIEGLKHELERW